MGLLSKIGASERVFHYIYLLLNVHAPVAQLDRVPGFGPGGWGFEPSRAYNYIKLSNIIMVTWLFYFVGTVTVLYNLSIVKSVLKINQEVNSVAGIQWANYTERELVYHSAYLA